MTNHQKRLILLLLIGVNMARLIGMRKYLQSISNLVLPEPYSNTTKEFVEYVVEAHSWYKRLNVRDSSIDMMAFNFFVAPGYLIEAEGGVNERVYDQFQYLKYGVPGTLFDCKHKIPRELYDAGLVIVPGDYKSKLSQRIMVARVANVLNAVTEYQKRYPSLKKNKLDLKKNLLEKLK